MHFFWNEEKIVRFLDASKYTGFHNKLAENIRPHLDSKDTFCDLGCGLGRIDLELSPFVSHITAVDINPDVLNRLDTDILAYGIKNISTICMDTDKFSGLFDVVFMSFFGKCHDISQYYKLCKKKLIRIVNAENKGNLYPQRYRNTQKDTISTVKNELLKTGLPYQLEHVSIEFGQPFKTLDEAESFVFSHAPDAERHDILEFLNSNIQKADSCDFKYYLPNQKEMGIFIINMEGYNENI